MNIEQLITALDPYIGKKIIGVSREFDSYRGYYEHIAMAESISRVMPVVSFSNVLADQIGKTYTGYKGGQFTMDQDTEVFVAEYGCTGKWVVGVGINQDGDVYLITSDKDFNGF